MNHPSLLAVQVLPDGNKQPPEIIGQGEPIDPSLPYNQASSVSGTSSKPILAGDPLNGSRFLDTMSVLLYIAGIFFSLLFLVLIIKKARAKKK